MCGNQTEQGSNPGSSASYSARTHLSQLTHLESGHETDPHPEKLNEIMDLASHWLLQA